MKELERLPAPEFLIEKAESWGIRYEGRRNQNPSAAFNWTKHKGRRINLILLPILMEMTQDHCSFCDGFPIETVSSNSIEHFRPKSQFPTMAYVWENLFYCCSKCQESKLENFNDLLLKPDEAEYSFEYYFQYDTATGEIIPNPDRKGIEFESAQITIQLYGLNLHGRPQARKRTIRQFLDSKSPIFNEFPYRFVLNLIL